MNPDSELDEDDFDSFVCEDCCATKCKATVGRWAGVPGKGAMLVNAAGAVLGRLPPSVDHVDAPNENGNGPTDDDAAKRKRTSSSPSLSTTIDADGDGDAPAPKRPKLTTEAQSTRATCHAPQPRDEPTGWQAIKASSAKSAGVFLADGWRERWCRCNEVCMTRSTPSVCVILDSLRFTVLARF